MVLVNTFVTRLLPPKVLTARKDYLELDAVTGKRPQNGKPAITNSRSEFVIKQDIPCLDIVVSHRRRGFHVHVPKETGEEEEKLQWNFSFCCYWNRWIFNQLGILTAMPEQLQVRFGGAHSMASAGRLHCAGHPRGTSSWHTRRLGYVVHALYSNQQAVQCSGVSACMLWKSRPGLAPLLRRTKKPFLWPSQLESDRSRWPS